MSISHVMWLTPAENPGGGGIVNLSVSYLWKISEKFSWAPVNPEKLKSILLQNILPRVSMDRGNTSTSPFGYECTIIQFIRNTGKYAKV